MTAAAFWPERGISCRGEEAEAMALEIWKAREESMLYMKAYHMPQTVNILGGDMGHMLEEIPFSQWEKDLTDHFSRYTWKDTVWLAKAFRAVREQDSMRMLAWRAACGISRASWETAALENMAEESDGFADNVLGGLREYALCRIKLCEEIYKEKIIRSMPDLLPEEYQGAYVIRNLLEKTEAAQYAEAVESVREIMNLLPGLAPIMRHYLKWLEIQLERQKKESTQAAGELQVLARQIKARVHALMEAGQYEAALGVTEQLLPLLPGDGELRSLREKIAGRIGNR